jgi:hypothetical protein
MESAGSEEKVNSDAVSAASATLEERKLEQEVTAKQRELDLKEREVSAQEREAAAKEKELERSRWLNPTVIAIFAAAIGLISSVVVARLNNKATQDLERSRSQSTIILEAIRTGTGNTDAACKNLVFLSNLQLIDDPQQTIHKQCASVPAGIPSLPSGFQTDNTADRAKLAESLRTLKNPQSSLKFRAELKGSCRPQETQQYSCYDGDQAELVFTNEGPFSVFVAAVDVGPTMSVNLLTESTVAVQPKQTIQIGTIMYTRPFGRDTVKVIAAKEPFDVNLFFESQHLRGVNTLPRNGDWAVIDLLVDTSARPGQLPK